MARVTVEDCLQHIPNRFELVMIAAKRARQLAMEGAEPTVAWENDKPTVVALREIAMGAIIPELLEGDVVAVSIANRAVKAQQPVSLGAGEGETGEVI